VAGARVGANVGGGGGVFVAGGGAMGVADLVGRIVEVGSCVACFPGCFVGVSSVGCTADGKKDETGVFSISEGTNSCCPTVSWSAVSRQLINNSTSSSGVSPSRAR